MWFRKYEMSHNRTKRQIYLATDEPQVDSTGSILHSLTKYTELLSAGARRMPLQVSRVHNLRQHKNC
jgi:hypothetical protein